MKNETMIVVALEMALMPVFLCVAAIDAKAVDFNIEDFGAKPDGTACTMAFKSAISAAAAVGNNEDVGRVIVPPGEWETGPLHLKSNVELHRLTGGFHGVPWKKNVHNFCRGWFVR